MPLTRRMAAKLAEDATGKQTDPPFYDAENDKQRDDVEDEENNDQTVPKTYVAGAAKRHETQALNLHPYDVGRLIPEYALGDGVCKWLRRIDHFRAIYGWSEQMCLLYATTRLAGAAANWYRRHEEWIFNWR